jgi:uncharacterized protein (DUF488 family)
VSEKKGFVTIGHGKRDLNTFIYTLLRYKVNCIVDVRSSPYSKFSPQFNREILASELNKHNITYKWFGDSLGGRPSDLSTYDENGIVDYDKLIKSDAFSKGLKELEELSVPYNVCIMCSEHDPLRCHRFLAVSKELARRGYRILHIIDERQFAKQSTLEDKLVEIHYGECIQLDLFSENQDYLAQSYVKQNKVCAYRRK